MLYEGGAGEWGFRLFDKVRHEDGDGVEEGVDVVDMLEADEGFEVAEGDGDFGLVAWVAMFGWVVLVQFGGELFVGMELEGEGFGDGQDPGNKR